MKNNTLLRFGDFKRNIVDYILLSFLGIAAIVPSVYFEMYDFSMDENVLPFVLAVVAIAASLRYTTNIFTISYKKEVADFAYSLPISKTRYYLSKMLAVVTLVFITLCTVGIVGGLMIMRNPFFIFSDVLFAIVGAMVTGMLITGALFLSLSVTGRSGSTLLLLIAALVVPAVFGLTGDLNLSRMSELLYGQINLLTMPNLYTLTNTLFLQVRGNIIYYGMFRAWLFTTGLGMAYAGAGLYMFRKRDAQATGEYTMNKWVNYICMAVIPFFILYAAWGYVFKHIYAERPYFAYIYSQDTFTLGTALGLFGVALLLTYLYSIVTKGGLKRKNRCIWVYLVTAAVCLLSNYAIFQSIVDIPKPTIDSQDISHINVVFKDYSPYVNQVYSEFSNYGGHMAEQLDIVDEDIFEDIGEFYRENKDYSIVGIWNVPLIRIHMNDGQIEYASLRTMEMFDDSPTAYYGYELQSAYYQAPTEDVIKNVLLDNMLMSDEQIAYFYPTFLEEYSNLSLEQQKYHNNKIFEQEDHEKSPFTITSLIVFGKVGLVATSDQLRITKETPQTAQKAFAVFNNEYADAINEWIDTGDMPDVVVYTLLKDGDFVSGNNIEEDDEYNYLINIIKNYDMSPPKISDNIAVITYWDNNNNPKSYGRIYITISDEEFEVLDGFAE